VDRDAGPPWNDPVWCESFDSWSTPAVALGAGLRVARVNRAFASRLGKAPADCVEQRWADLLGIDTDAAARVARSGNASEIDVPALAGPHLVSAHTFGPAAADGVVVTLQDVADRPSAEWRATELETWLALALDSGRIGTWDWDVARDRVYYIPLLGGDSGGLVVRETIGADWAQSVHPADLGRASAAVQRAVAGETDLLEYNARIRLSHYRSGHWFHVRCRGRVLGRGDGGRATRIVGIHQDITDLVRLQEIEREQAEVLARSVRLTSLSALASSLAHEINQPLAALTSYLETALELARPGAAPGAGQAGRTEPTAPLVQTLQRSLGLLDRTSEIVRRLVRPLHRQEPVCERVEVGALLERVRQALVGEARAARVELEVEDGCGSTVLWGDGIQLEQALLNLGRNAIEALATSACRERRVCLSASLEAGAVALGVTDTGPGVPADIRSRLFAPFFTTKRDGTGLGLMVCESVAELHGGQLRASLDVPGQTRFQLVLPLQARAAPG